MSFKKLKIISSNAEFNSYDDTENLEIECS